MARAFHDVTHSKRATNPGLAYTGIKTTIFLPVFGLERYIQQVLVNLSPQKRRHLQYAG